MDKLARKPPRFPHQIMGGSQVELVESMRVGKRPGGGDVTGQRSPQAAERVRIAQNFAVSCLSATLAHVPHHPLYTLKAQMMNNGINFRIRKFLTSTLKSRGTFLMRGVVVRCIGIAPEKALKMAAWDGGINFINYAYPQCSKGLQWTFCGAMAGVGTTILGCPSERLMVLKQTSGITLRQIMQSNSALGVVRTLYLGTLATLFRDVTFNSCMFATRAFVMNQYEEGTGVEPAPYMKVWYGLPGSVLAGVLACPFDVVKTRIQAVEYADPHSRRPFARMAEIARAEGVRSLFKGLLPRVIVVPMYMSVFITVNEELQKWILGRRIVT